MQNHQHSVYSVAWSPDGRRLASASGDRSVKIWDATTGEEVLSYQGHTSEVLTVAWSPDGTRMASAGYDQTAQLWDSVTGQRALILRGHTTHIAQVAWSPDGTRLASAGRDDTVKVWDTQSGKQALSLESPASHVNAVAWSPDGMVLACGGEDHQIHIHDASAGYLAARASQLLPAIDRRLAADSSQSADWRIRAEVHARKHEWKQAADDVRQYLLLKPDPEWFLLDGVVAGPYPSDMTRHFPPEDHDVVVAHVRDVDGLGSPARVNWKVVPYSAQGVVDFGHLMDHTDHVSAYVLFVIYSSHNQQVAILVGSDDQARLWLNGERLYESLRSRAAVADEDAILGLLKSGWNLLLVRVANETGDHALYLRLSNSETDLARVRGSAK